MPKSPTDVQTDLDELIGELAEEYAQRLRDGEKPDIEQYARQHPDVADAIRQILPALEIMGAVPGQRKPHTGEPAFSNGQNKALGDFEIVREVGRGGMGVVYEARQLSLSRRVALKVLPFAAVLDERQIQRFRNEALAAAQLDHPHIVDVYGVGCERSVHFYAMRYVEGDTLAEVIAELRRLQDLSDTSPKVLPESGPSAPTSPIADNTPALAALSTHRSASGREFFRSVARIGVEVAQALDHAHQQGVIHRDIKPANVIIDATGKSWVTDFGLARMESGATLTMTGDLLGTLRYMSPEQALAKRVVVDHRTDVYSLGITLYELLTLQPAYAGEDRHELLRKIAFEEPKPPRKLNLAVPEELETIILKAIAKNANDRYETAQEFADDLQRYLDDKPIRAKRPGLVQIAGHWMRRNSGLVASIAIIFLLTTVAASAAALLVTREQSITQAALGDAEDQRDRADRIAEQSRRQLLGIQVARGTELLNEGDPDGLLELLEACRTADAGDELDGLAGYAWAYAHQTWEDRLKAVLPGSESIAFSPDGRLFATANQTEANVWNAETGERIYPPLRMGRQISVVAFSPDGKWIATHCAEGVARFWDSATGQPVSPKLEHEQIVEDPRADHIPWSAAFRPDGRLLATNGTDGTIRFWSVPSGELYGEPLDGMLGQACIAFSPDGRLLAAATRTEQESAGVFVWDVDTQKLERPPFGRPRKCEKLLFTPDGAELVVVTTDGVSRWWNLAENRVRLERRSPSSWALDAAFSPDGQLFATADRGWSVDIYDRPDETTPSRSLSHDAGAWRVDFSPNGKLIASGSMDQTARIWEASTGRPVSPQLTHMSEVSRVLFSPNGELLATAGTENEQKRGNTRLWQVRPRTISPFCQIPAKSGAVRFSDDAKQLAVPAPGFNGYTIWETSTSNPYDDANSCDVSRSYAAAFTADGTQIIVGCWEEDPHLRYWDIHSGQFTAQKMKIHGSPYCVAVNQNDTRVAVSVGWTTDVLDIQSGEVLYEISPQERTYGLAVSLDNRRLVTATWAGIAQQWNLRSGKPYGPPMEHPGSLWSVAYSPDGNLLATVCEDRERGNRYAIYLWFIGWGYPYQHIVLPVEPAAPPLGNASHPTVHFDPDGNLLFRGETADTISIWPAPELPKDLAEVELKTHVALGLRRSDVGPPEAIAWQEWWQLRRQLDMRGHNSEPEDQPVEGWEED